MTTGSVDGRARGQSLASAVVTLCGRVASSAQQTGLLTSSVRHPSQPPECPCRTRAERSDSPPLNPGTATGGRSLSPAFTQNHGRPFRARTMGEDAALPSVLLHVPASRAPPPVRRIADPRLAVDSTAAIVHARLQNLELGRLRPRCSDDIELATAWLQRQPRPARSWPVPWINGKIHGRLVAGSRTKRTRS
jgi:hypothetical protein